jgi:GNAT superfamily N-acetyltransferase
VTFVAFDQVGAVAGAVGLGEFDPAERRHWSPWLLGMIVWPDLRAHGVGGLLLANLESWASGHSYRSCGPPPAARRLGSTAAAAGSIRRHSVGGRRGHSSDQAPAAIAGKPSSSHGCRAWRGHYAAG